MLWDKWLNVLWIEHWCVTCVSRWFLRPTRDMAVLHRRQEAIRFFASPCNSDVAGTLQSLLRNIRNIPVLSNPPRFHFSRAVSSCNAIVLLSQLLMPETVWVWVCVCMCVYVCVCVCVCVSDSPAQNVSITHKSNGLAESVQGRKCSALQNKIKIKQNIKQH